MKSYCFALAALAVMGFAGAAYAGDAGPKTMSDSELDKVTAAGNGATVNYAGTRAMTITLPKGAQANSPHPNGNSDYHAPTFY